MGGEQSKMKHKWYIVTCTCTVKSWGKVCLGEACGVCACAPCVWTWGADPTPLQRPGARMMTAWISDERHTGY